MNVQCVVCDVYTIARALARSACTTSPHSVSFHSIVWLTFSVRYYIYYSVLWHWLVYAYEAHEVSRARDLLSEWCVWCSVLVRPRGKQLIAIIGIMQNILINVPIFPLF